MAAEDLTELLRLWSDGDAKARDALVAAVYDELRNIARRQLRREAGGESLAPTGLVHEAYLRCAGFSSIARGRGGPRSAAQGRFTSPSAPGTPPASKTST
jgi:hypothetical protein